MVPDVTLLLLIDQNSKQQQRVHGHPGDKAETGEPLRLVAEWGRGG